MQAEAINYIKFTLISPEEIKKLSVAKITVPDTYNEEGYPIDGGLVDQRLGVIDPGLKCKTCGGKAKVCPGHFGHIDLVRPVIHPEFAKVIYMLMRSTCSTCHRLLLTPEKVNEISEDIKSFISAEDQEDATLILAEDDRNALIKQLRTIKKCPHCGAQQPKIKFERPTYFYVNNNKIKPDEIREWLSKIPDSDLKLIGIDPTATRPEWFILTTLLVPPVNVRPSITLESGERSEDDLTHKLVDIIRSNQRLEQDIDAGAPQIIIDDLWELLQFHITTYFNNETPGVPVARHRTTKPLKTLVQRLKGKEGRLRYNLSGKRVNFSARSVISVDPSLSINQIGIPKRMAENLTIPIYVTNWNIEECKKMLNNKIDKPVVNFFSQGGLRKRVTDSNIDELINELKPGVILERKLMDNDLVLFNRQPTLHRLSIMAHQVKIVPGKTLRLNVEITEPYNADFDGDEMNIHVPQSLEAQAEARYLMQPKNQLLSPRDGKAIAFLNEDELIGLYWLTKNNALFSKEETTKMLASVGIYELPKAEKNGEYNGKSIVSMLFPKDFNMEMQGIMGKIKIVDGKLVEGIIDVEAAGRRAKLLQEIYIKYGPDKAEEFMSRLSKLALYASASGGMTLSIKDYYPSPEMLKERKIVLEDIFKKTYDIEENYKEKKLEPLAGYTRKETYEILTLAQLDSARSIIEKSIKKYLTLNDKAFLIPSVKARGNITNFVQITMFLGQQSIRGARPSRGYSGRVLPYFKKGDKAPEAKGFISSSFLDGMNPIELYMHTMGGRDSAMGKSLLTAVSGYLQRRLVNALQDLYVKEDLSVRDASGAIIQTIYGGDGIDPTKVKFAEEMVNK
ncbi:MAG: DNA-directed RNA polymerase subunit A' [Candidatus Micrarchaeia archaeon]